MATQDKLKTLFDAVDWSPHCRCPRCQRGDPETHTTEPIDADTHTRKRYHRCQCGALFASLELIRPIPTA